MGHKLDKVGGKAKKSLSSLKLNKDKKNLDSVPEGRELGGLGEGEAQQGPDPHLTATSLSGSLRIPARTQPPQKDRKH